MKRALKSYRRNKYNSSVKLNNRIDSIFTKIEKNYTKILYIPLVVLVFLIVVKITGYLKLSWEQILVYSLLLYFPLGVMIPVLYFIFRKKLVLILIAFLLIYGVDFFMNFNNDLIGMSALIFCYSVGGFFAILNILGILLSIFTYIKNIIK